MIEPNDPNDPWRKFRTSLTMIRAPRVARFKARLSEGLMSEEPQ